MSPHVLGRSRRLCARVLILSSFALPWSAVEAGLVYWGSQGFVENADSKGRPWDESYTMEIGVFPGGFVPEPANYEEWSGRWTPLGSARLDAAEGRFAGVLDVADFPSVPAGAKVYLWAKNGGDLTKGPEWVLLSGREWVWPASVASTLPPVTWTTGEGAVTLVAGRREVEGKHLVSRAFRPVPISQEEWLAAFFPGDTEIPEDADGDGLSNAFEYLLGTDPSSPNSAAPAMQRDAAVSRLMLPRNPYAESSYVLEGSSDLVEWSPLAHETLTERPDLIEVGVPHEAGEPARFFRFRLVPLPTP